MDRFAFIMTGMTALAFLFNAWNDNKHKRAVRQERARAFREVLEVMREHDNP